MGLFSDIGFDYTAPSGADSPVTALALVYYDNALGYYRSVHGPNTPQTILDALHQYADARANLAKGINLRYPWPNGAPLTGDVINTLAAAAGLPLEFVDSPAAVALATPSQNVFNQITKAASDAGHTVSTVTSDVAKGNVTGAAKAAVAGAKAEASDVSAVVKNVATNVAADASHIENAVKNAAQDALNDVEGAWNTLKALVGGLTPAGLVAMVQRDIGTVLPAIEKGMGIKPGSMGADAKKPLDPNEIDFSFLPIPKSGVASVVFPSSLRGQTIYWKDFRKNAFGIIWYLAAVTVVDFMHMIKLAENMIGSDFTKLEHFLGIKGADSPRGTRTLGLAPVAAGAAQASGSILPIVIAIITAATAILGALTPVVLAMLKKNGVMAPPPAGPPPPPPPGTPLPTPPYPPGSVVGPGGQPIGPNGQPLGPGGQPLAVVGHSSMFVTVGVVGLVIVLVALLLWPAEPTKG